MSTVRNPDLPPTFPSETVRGLISLLLIVHLFAIGVALSAYPSASALQQRLSATMRPYVRTFNFDLVHVFPAVARLQLTHAGPVDVDFSVRGTARLKDGGVANWQLPRNGLFPGVRQTRDQTLANVIGSLTENEEEAQQSLLPRAVSAAELRRAGAQAGTISVTAHYLQDFEDLSAPETHLRDPFDASFFRPVFEASVIAGRNGSVDLLKTVAKGEVAPVTGASGTTGKPRPANGKP